jgi:hypothetical protein
MLFTKDYQEMKFQWRFCFVKNWNYYIRLKNDTLIKFFNVNIYFLKGVELFYLKLFKLLLIV